MAKKSHYTPQFLAAYEPVKKALAEGRQDEARILFRDAMLKLGHDERIRNLYRCKDKLSRKAKFFVPNALQERYLRTRKGRDNILKIRQVGFTTLNCIRAYDYACWEENRNTGIMAHEQSAVRKIFKEKVKFAHDWFKRDWGHLYSPKEENDNSTTISFSEDGCGRVLKSTVCVAFDFRSQTVDFLHISEAAYVDEERLLGSMQTVPANGEVVKETTANGRGGEFYRSWESVKAAGVNATTRNHFIAWFEFYPEEPGKWHLPDDAVLTSYEEELLRLFPDLIKPYMIAWRRWCVEENCQGDPEKFEKEYPSNDRDCFLSGANQVFPSSLLKNQDRHVRPATKIGFLLNAGNGRFKLEEDRKGIVSIWEEPDYAATYVCGADPSGGVGKDRGAAYIKNRKNGKYVARLCGDLEPDDFAAEVWKLITYYNRAFICVEENNHGHTVISKLKEKPGVNFYRRPVYDERTNKITRKIGFQTTNESKLAVTERLKSSCKNGRAFLMDGELVSEMSTFIQVASKTGRSIKREATSGCKDDLVMAASFTEEMDAQLPSLDEEAQEADHAEEFEELVQDSETGFYG